MLQLQNAVVGDTQGLSLDFQTQVGHGRIGKGLNRLEMELGDLELRGLGKAMRCEISEAYEGYGNSFPFISHSNTKIPSVASQILPLLVKSCSYARVG